jgi:hypothetical protein
MIPFIAEAKWVQPENYELYAMTPHGFWLGMIAFLTGFLCVYAGPSFWENATKLRWVLLLFAFTLYVLRLQQITTDLSQYLIPVESNLWIYTVFGWGHKYLNRPGKILTYLSAAAYPVYIIHMVFLYLASLIVFPMDIYPVAKLMLVILLTFAGCFISYEFLIRRINWIRPFFGLKEKSGFRKNSIPETKGLRVEKMYNRIVSDVEKDH